MLNLFINLLYLRYKHYIYPWGVCHVILTIRPGSWQLMLKSMGLGPDTDSWRVMYCSYVLLNNSHSIKTDNWLDNSNYKSGPSWPWSYGSWIYNYLCNQCLSHWCCEFESPSGEVYNIMWYSLSVTWLHQQNWPPRYNWNTVESGVKLHQTNKQP